MRANKCKLLRNQADARAYGSKRSRSSSTGTSDNYTLLTCHQYPDKGSVVLLPSSTHRYAPASGADPLVPL